MSKVQVTLEAPIRDYIVDTVGFILEESTLKRLKKASVDKLGYIKCTINKFELDHMISDLIYEGDKAQNRESRRTAYHAAGVLEIYSR